MLRVTWSSVKIRHSQLTFIIKLVLWLLHDYFNINKIYARSFGLAAVIFPAQLNCHRAYDVACINWGRLSEMYCSVVACVMYNIRFSFDVNTNSFGGHTLSFFPLSSYKECYISTIKYYHNTSVYEIRRRRSIARSTFYSDKHCNALTSLNHKQVLIRDLFSTTQLIKWFNTVVKK